ncbi:Uncharacterised protein [Mycolicibacterium aichiense]|nr:Uncharacterised protein [Mycolicibacterium aichiense]
MSSKSKRGGKGPQVLGLVDRRRTKKPCGICGIKKRMTQSHIPPRCAGNEMLVKRYRLVVNGNEVDSGRQDPGGIHLYGLCGDCNSQAGQFDNSYGDFARQLQPLWIKSRQMYVPPMISMPSITFDPGAVVRSILLGMCATGPVVHRNWPDWPRQLFGATPVEMPPGVRLFLALARGVTARVAGPIAGFPIVGPQLRRDASGAPVGINAVASVYFPPFAWELIYPGETSLTDERWADVSKWTTIRPGDTRVLSELVPALPAVYHPWHDPSRNQNWLELFSSEITRIVECANVEGGPPDPHAPSTVDKRAHISTEMFDEFLRKRGMAPPHLDQTD